VGQTVHYGAGFYNRRITIQTPVDTPDGAGGFVRVWTDVFSTWANVAAKGGNEPFFAQQVYPHMQYTVKYRYRRAQPVNGNMRVIYGTHVLNIRDVVDEDEGHVNIVLKCEELQAKGSQL